MIGHPAPQTRGVRTSNHDRSWRSKRWLGRTEFLTPTIRSELKVGKRKPSTRAKWRSSKSACRRALKKCLTPPTLLEMAIFRQSFRTVSLMREDAHVSTRWTIWIGTAAAKNIFGDRHRSALPFVLVDSVRCAVSADRFVNGGEERLFPKTRK